MSRRVVITGMGVVSPIGNSLDEMWESAKAGKCGIDEITAFDTTNFKVKLAGELKNFVPENYIDKREIRKMDRFVQLGMAASKEAFESSGLNMDEEDAERCGVIISSGIGGLGTIEVEHAKGQEKGFERISPYFVPMAIANIAAGQVAIKYGLKGKCQCIVTACASGTDAVGESFHYIRDGYADVMLCGGAESCVTQLGIGGFAALRALSTSTDKNRASIPFDKERSGFVLGEGAGTLVLEEYEHAKARGAEIYGEVIGYGATCDAHHITAPAPGGEGGAHAMLMAVKDGGIAPEDVDYINAHGTSTSMNDACETAGVKAAFGEHAKELMISSTKSMTGHMLGASGAVEAIITAMALKEGFVPATINYKVPDEKCDLDIVPNEGRVADIKYAISNSFGFGGHNASILLKKWEE